MNKYEWIEAVMASKMKQAVKVFAFGIYKHMNNGTAWPGDKALMEATGMKRGHFSEYRRTLMDEGWITLEPRKTKNGTSYIYGLPNSMPPQGNQNATIGEQNATIGEQNATARGMNTVSNTYMNTGSNTVTTTDAKAPVEIKDSSLKEEQAFSCFLDVPKSYEDYQPLLEFQTVELGEFTYKLFDSGVTKELSEFSFFSESKNMVIVDYAAIEKIRPLTEREKAAQLEQVLKYKGDLETVTVGDSW